MSHFLMLKSGLKVIDKFGQFVITFKTNSAAVKFLESDGKEYDPQDVESIEFATDEDRVEAGLPTQSDKPVIFPLPLDQVELRVAISKFTDEVESKNSAAKVVRLKI